MTERFYTLKDLLAAASAAENVPIADRMAQQYLDAGVLFPLPGAKPGRFAEAQLHRLRLASRLTAQYVPVREIRSFVDRLSLAALPFLLERPIAARLPSEGDVRAYLERLLQSFGPGSLQPPAALSASSFAVQSSVPVDRGDAALSLKSATRSEWLQVEIDADVTLLVRIRPGGRQHQVDQMIAALQAVLVDDA